MSDLFATLERPAPRKVGQANGEFLARFAEMEQADRVKITPADFPHATPAFVQANVRLNGGHHANGDQP